MKKQLILALFGAAAIAGPFNIGSAQSAAQCSLEHCQQLMSLRAYDKGLCKTKSECRSWLAANNICSNKQLARCKKRDVEGLHKVPDLRTDGMDY